jgi:hypothetical protein
MNGFRKIFPIFLSQYATFFAKIAERKVVPFDEFYYQLKLMHLFQKHPYYLPEMNCVVLVNASSMRLDSWWGKIGLWLFDDDKNRVFFIGFWLV